MCDDNRKARQVAWVFAVVKLIGAIDHLLQTLHNINLL
jgi:hypothetical protein